jgi:uncharacterized membrane protein YesL
VVKLKIFPTVGMVLKNTFKEIYQSFLYSISISMVFGILSLPTFAIIYSAFQAIVNGSKSGAASNELILIFLIPLILSAIWNSLVIAPVITTFYSLHQARKESYPGIRTFFSLLWKHYLPSIAVNGLFSLIFVILSMNVMLGLMERTNLFFLSGVLSFYLQIFIGLMSFYFAPLIYLNNGIKKTIKKAFLLVFDNTLLTIVLMMILGIFCGLLLIFLPVWFLFYGAILVYVTDLGFNAIYDRYE